MGCIDYQNIKESFPDNSRLQYFLESFGSDPRNYRHKGQRKHCLCMLTKDIGQYGTCGYNCVYCYAKKKQ